MIKKKINSKTAFFISGLYSLIFALFALYKAIILHFINLALEDTFVGGETSDISITLWFLICGIMSFTTFLFFLFLKIKDFKSQKLIISGVAIYWLLISVLLIVLYTEYFFMAAFNLIPIIICLIAIKNLRIDIINHLKKNKLTEKEIHLLQLLAGVKKK